MSHLSLLSLGVPEVHHAGKMLKFRTRKALALLMYLAVEGGVHSREKLTALFWPESDEVQGRTILRTTLVYVRNTLLDSDTAAHLTVGREALGFDFSSDFDLDLHAIEAAFKLARASSTAHVPQGEQGRHLLSQLQYALALYRGSFLEGFSLGETPGLDEWMRLQREIWHCRLSVIFDHLSHMQEEGGELAAALDTTTRWVAHDALNEAAHRRLMHIHLATGDRSTALQAYETCRTTLMRELRVRPTPETEALAERIHHLEVIGSRSHPKKDGINRPPSASATLPEVPLIGRANEYGTLIEVYHAIQRGAARVVVLQGEAGIGKTRLATEFLGWAEAHGADILQGRAFEMGGRLPYQPLVESLRGRIERENAPDDLLSDTWLAELSRLLPELRDRYPDLSPPTGDDPAARIRLFDAIAHLGQSLAERAPIVLFVDDLQWADAASLDILHYAGQRWTESKTPILMLLALRVETLASTSTLTRWLSTLKHDVQGTSLELDSLTLEDTLQLLSTVGETEPESKAGKLEEVGRWLFAETHGQPFYLIETLKALFERGLLTLRAHTGDAWTIDFEEAMDAMHQAPARGLLPPGVRDVIRARLSHLTSVALTLLVAGAVLDHGFTFEHLRQVATLGEHEGLQALDEAMASRLLREATSEERRSTPGAYFFTHDKIRDVVYTEAGEARRRIFHRRALEILQADHRSAAELVAHAIAAGMEEHTFVLSLAAGNDAMRLFAVRTAIAHYEQAQHCLVEHWSVTDLPASIAITAIQELFARLGRAHELLGDTESARSVYETMLALAQTSQTPTMECAALNRLATLAAQNHTPENVERSMSLLQQALQVAEQYNDLPGLAETEWNLAQSGVGRVDPHFILAHGERALALARQLSTSELIGRSLNGITYARMMLAQWEEAIRLAEEAKGVFRTLGNRAMEADCLAQIAVSNINCGFIQACLNAAREAYAISVEIESPWGQVNSLAPLSWGLLDSGCYEQALEIAQQAMALVNQHGLLMLYFPIIYTIGIVNRAMHACEKARTAHLEGWSVAQSVGIPTLREGLASELCADYALVGKWEEAQRFALEALENRCDFILMSSKRSYWYETEALVRAGRLEQAAQDALRYGATIGSSRRYRIPYLRALAIVAEARGSTDEARGHLQEAATLAEAIGLPGERWPILAALGELYRVQGEQEQSQNAFKEAAAIVQQLAGNIGDDVQRANFLAAAKMRQLVN